MRRAGAACCATVLLVAAAAVIVAPSESAAASSETWTYFKDKFQERDYDGNDSSGKFSTDWIEVGEANGPLKGYTSVSDHDYCYTYCLQLGAGDLAVGNTGVERSLNLAGSIEAKLTYIFATDLYGGSTEQRIALQISSDGGEEFVTLETYQLNEDEGMERQDYIDITEWAAPQTVIRFVSLDGATDNVLLIDDFLVKSLFPDGSPPATTTTTSTSTTTTTTQPPATTTTTTKPPDTTTTTTKPPETTTTTAPPTTTTSTTIPPDTSTTTTTSPPAVTEFQLPPPGTAASFRTKDALVTTDVAHSQVPNDRRQEVGGSAPVRLLVNFRTAAEGFTGSAIPSTLLGVLIAVLAVVGLSRGFKADTQ
jgi:hypothetical protein